MSSDDYNIKFILRRVSKIISRLEWLLTMVLRGKILILFGKFVRSNGALAVVVFLSLLVSVSNIYARTNENALLKGYWHNFGNEASKYDVEGLALNEDFDINDEQKLIVSENAEKNNIESDLTLLADDEDVMLADEDMGDIQVYQGTDAEQNNKEDTIIYTVKEGDTVDGIAKKYNLTVDTILWANDLDNPNQIKPGDTILLLPISGVQHKVKEGEDVDKIAKKYKASKEEIIKYNDLPANGELKIGEVITIPGGTKEKPKPKVTATKSKFLQRRVYSRSTPTYANTTKSGYFSRPIKGGVRTQGLHRTNAVDLAAPIGTPIYAAASGDVVIAKYGWNGGYGNYIVISHPNGTKTLYAHLKKGGILVKRGQHVKRGQLIGKMGSTGRSTGPHVHFEIRGARNPF